MHYTATYDPQLHAFKIEPPLELFGRTFEHITPIALEQLQRDGIAVATNLSPQKSQE